MQMSLDKAAGLNLISAYSNGQVKIQGITHKTSLLVLSTGTISDWPVPGISGLDSKALRSIVQYRPEIVILGTGNQQHFPDPKVFIPLMDAGIGYEVMDNAAACRTYNILLSEGRKAALGLLSEESWQAARDTGILCRNQR